MKAAFCRYILQFNRPATTSRAVMLDKETYFIKIWNETHPNTYGIGECALFRGLSADDVPQYEQVLREVCRTISNLDTKTLKEFSSIRFGVETALKDLHNGGRRIIYPTAWVEGKDSITINGLVWMGSYDEMFARIDDKLKSGFRCVKLKVGGIDFDRELDLIKHIRTRYASSELELRLDANGAFKPENAITRLNTLAKYSIHSIEQPIKQGQLEEMAQICANSPIPIALDEELIGVNSQESKRELLEKIKPQYIILKPALCGGLSGSEEWIKLANEHNIGWWVTSALESNVGLNAIAQWVATLNNTMPQGLGTGQLYTNNIESPLIQEHDVLRYNTHAVWNIPQLNWIEP